MASPLFFETIKVEGGKAFNLFYHQTRVERTSRAFYNTEAPFELNHILSPPNDKLLYRCRVIYGKALQTIEYIPYKFKTMTHFKIVHTTLDYDYKYFDREALHALKPKSYDDIFIAKKGLLTDTTIANIALFKKGIWYTPKTPLLHGTMREKLLNENRMITTDIPIDSLHTYSKVALMNAMIGFLELKEFTIER
jgi:4-amino-4-deoxychorismate lyase